MTTTPSHASATLRRLLSSSDSGIMLGTESLTPIVFSPPVDSTTLETANDWTWATLELMLGCERLSRVGPDDPPFARDLARVASVLYEQVAPEEFRKADPEWRLICWQQLRSARGAGLLGLHAPHHPARAALEVADRNAIGRLAEALEQSSWFCVRPLLEMRARQGEYLCLALLAWFARARLDPRDAPAFPPEWTAALDGAAALLKSQAVDVEQALRAACGAPGAAAAAPPAIDTMAAALHFQRGLSAVGSGNYEQAVLAFAAAIQNNPGMEQAYTQRGDAHRLLGAYDRALLDYTTARKLNPANPRVLINRGQTYRMLGRIQLAMADYDLALQLDPASVVALNHRGTARAEVGDHDAAIADFTRALALDPDNPFTYQNRAHSYAALSNFDLAIADYSQVLRLNPNFTLAYIRRADAYRQRDEHDRAIADYTEALRLDPLQLHALVSRGTSYQEQGQSGRALSDFESALKLGGSNPQIYLNRGIANRDNGAYDAAVADFECALRLDPNNPLIYLHRALAYKELDSFERALADLDEVVRRNPDSADAYFHRGTVRVKLRDADAAIADLTAAISLEPRNALAYLSRALAHSLNRDTSALERVAADCTRALEIDDTLLRAYKTRGTANYRLGNHPAALEDFERILYKQPNDIEALYNRGLIHSKLGDHESATVGLSRVLELAPASPRALAARAASYRILERDDDALHDYALALRYDSHYAVAFCNQRAFMHMKRGDRALALADCEIALLLDDDNKTAQMLQEQIRKEIPYEVARRAVPAPASSAELADAGRPAPKMLVTRPKKPARPSTDSMEFEVDKTVTVRKVAARIVPDDADESEDSETTVETTEVEFHIVEEDGSAGTEIEVVEEEAVETDPEVTLAKTEPVKVAPRRKKGEGDGRARKVAVPIARKPEPPREEEAREKTEPLAIAPRREKIRDDDLLVKDTDTNEYEKEQALLKLKQEREEKLKKAKQLQEEEEKLKQARAERDSQRKDRKKNAADDSGGNPWVQRIAGAAAVLVLAYFVGPLAWSYVTARSIPQNDEVELMPEFKVNTVEFCASFQKDAAAANAKYADRIVEIGGTVKDLKPGPDNSMAIVLADAKNEWRIVCTMPQPKSLSQGTMFSKLERQGPVTLKGKCTGFEGKTINLEGVQLVYAHEK